MALHLPSTGGAIDHGDSAALDGAGAFTLMAWLRRTSGNFTNNMFNTLKKGTNCYLYCSSNVAPNGFACYSGSGIETLVTTANLWDTTYFHYAITYSGAATVPLLYKNGAALTTNGVAQTYTDAAAEPLAWSNPGGSGFSVAHFKGWTAVLTLAEIRQEMLTRRLMRHANKLIWAPYDDGTDGRDYSGNGHHGTVMTSTVIDGPSIPFGSRPRTM